MPASHRAIASRAPQSLEPSIRRTCGHSLAIRVERGGAAPHLERGLDVSDGNASFTRLALGAVCVDRTGAGELFLDDLDVTAH